MSVPQEKEWLRLIEGDGFPTGHFIDPKELTSELQKNFFQNQTLSYNFRLQQLKNLLNAYNDNQNLILAALAADMKKSKLEAYLYEIDLMKNDVRSAIKNLKSWMSPTKIARNLLTPCDSAYIAKQPLGVVLVIGPWNYPFQLTLVPVCGAIAAGNCVVIKPSELSSASARVIKYLIESYLDKRFYRVVLADGEMTGNLVKEGNWDHIFFTGGKFAGEKIIQSVNRVGVGITLELGGKSPCYVDSTANLKLTAERLMWGKCMNMGQTCLAPDYVLCQEEIIPELVSHCRETLLNWYGKDMKQAKDLARIINLRHFERLKLLLEKHEGKILIGGGVCEQELWIEPSVVAFPLNTDRIMQDEIFGPILAIYPIKDEQSAINFINKQPKALCLYVFSDSAKTRNRFELETRSGTMAFNDTIVQFAIDELPFGGVGDSGLGYYHGKYSFDTFTHLKSIVRRDFSWIGDQVGIFRYPPYTPLKINFLSFLLSHWKKFKFVYFDYIPHLFCFLVGILFMWVCSLE